ncbi:MAG: transporter substrate-binding domain-containing protein [Muribaculaceae bacterium]
MEQGKSTPNRRRPAPIARGRVLTVCAALALVLALFFIVGRCSRSRGPMFPVPGKSGGDTLDIAIEVSPLSYNMSGDSARGLDYEMITAMAAANKRPIKLHPFAPLPYALKGLRESRFDIVISALPSTRRLKDSVLLSAPLYLDRQVLVQRRDDTTAVMSPQDLGGREVWVADGSPVADRIRNLAAEIGSEITVKTQPGRTAEHLVMLVSAGRIPNAVTGEGLIRRMAARDTILTYDTPVSFTQFQTWAVAPADTATLRLLDSWIARFRTTDTYRHLLDKYGMAAPK